MKSSDGKAVAADSRTEIGFTGGSPVVCSLSVLEAEQKKKHEALLNELLDARLETYELAGGYELSFPDGAEWYLKIAEWATLERLCCPFLVLEQGYDNQGRVWARLSGNDDIKRFLSNYLKYDRTGTGDSLK